MVVVDTHALVWYLTTPDRLSAKALDALGEAEEDEGGIAVPASVLAEVAQLAALKRRGFVPTDYSIVRETVFSEEFPGLNAVPFNPTAATLVARLAPSIREPFDLCITATALDLGLPLVTADRNITDSGLVSVIW